ncbi:MAG: hypothetical protein IKS96_07665 [Fibrobacter sp.]|nr:hypothetical protein [Fibrobacter sp.]
MNKKIFAGTVALGIAASFWACGSGEIIKPDNDDNTMAIQVPENPALGVSKDVMNSVTCPACFVGAPSSSSTKQQPKPQSSATIPGLSSAYVPPVQQSSSSEFEINLSSSTPYSYTPRSSSDPGPGPGPIFVSSSSETVIEANQAGTCAPDPTKATIDVNGTTTWKYTRGSGVAAASLLSAAFAWEFEGGTPPTASATGAGGMSQNVTYTTSGSHGAKLTLTIGSSHYPITCSPVQVNGAKITGCKCSALNKKPDIAAQELGTWSVTGCTSTGHQITGYEWSGATGEGPAATQAFTAKNQAAAPTVKVANDDNTVVTVQCDTVIAIDANDPDYILTKQDTKIQMPKGESTLVLDLPASWHGNDTKPATLRCDDAGGPVTITIGTKSSEASYSATISIPVEQTINKTAVVVNLSMAAKCQIAY